MVETEGAASGFFWLLLFLFFETGITVLGLHHCTAFIYFLNILTIILYVGMCSMLQYASRDQRATFWSRFSPSTTWVVGI